MNLLPGEGTFGECPSGSYKNIVVNTNLDIVNANDNRTSLREALNKTQQQPGCWNIIFQDVSENDINAYKKSQSDDIDLGYWTIKLNDSLPALQEGKIRINYDFPKTVTLIPASFNKKTPDDYIQLKPKSGNNGSGSLLNVGDLNISNLSGEEIPQLNVKFPSVEINNFNFIKNKAVGGNGSGGGGGGFGAGGGISLFSGALKVENSVFQGLGAEGGSAGGSCGGSAGSNAGINYGDVFSGTKGGSGGVGGQFSAGIGRGGSGGGGGAPGVTEETHYSVTWAMLNGKRGGRGGTGQYGSGGGGGGGGGGAGMEYYDMSDWEGMADREIENHDRRKHRLIDDDADRWNGERRGPLHLYPGSKGSVGNGGSGGSPGLNAGRGANGRPGCGGQQNGSAKGAAIAIHDIKIKGGNKNAELYLSNVNFIGNNLPAASADIWAGGNENKVYMNNVGYAESTSESVRTHKEVSTDRRQLIEINKSNLHDIDPKSLNSLHYGYSAPVNDTYAKRNPRWSTIKMKEGIADTAIVRYESPGSGLKSINADSSALTESINDLWREILPDREKEIAEKHQSAISSAWINGGLSLASGLSSVRTLANIASYNPVTSAPFALLSAAASTAASIYTANAERDEALKKNKENMEKLQTKISQNREIKFQPINIINRRSTVFIDDFHFGEDSILFQNIPAGGITFKLGTDKKGSFFDLHSEELNDDNTAKRFARIYPSAESIEALSEGDKSAVDYIQTLTSYTDNTGEIILSRYSKPVTLTNKQTYGSNIESALVAVKRTYADTKDKLYSIYTQGGDDQIYGSNGKEEILTRPGNDIIRPLLGKDTIDGGEGFDTVIYDHFPVEINAAANGGSSILRVSQRSFLSHSPESTKTTPDTTATLQSARVDPDTDTVEISLTSNISNNLPKPNQFEITQGGIPIAIKNISHADNLLSIELQEEIQLSDKKEFFLSYQEPSLLNDLSALQTLDGIDIAGFTLANDPESRQWATSGELTLQILDSELRNIEALQVRGNSKLDLSAAPAHNELTPKTGYELITGWGSNVTGSPLNDKIIISMANENAPLTSPNLSCTPTFIDGKYGDDVLEIDLPNNYKVKHYPDSNHAGTIRYKNPEGQDLILTYKNIKSVQINPDNLDTSEQDRLETLPNNSLAFDEEDFFTGYSFDQTITPGLKDLPMPSFHKLSSNTNQNTIQIEAETLIPHHLYGEQNTCINSSSGANLPCQEGLPSQDLEPNSHTPSGGYVDQNGKPILVNGTQGEDSVQLTPPASYVQTLIDQGDVSPIGLYPNRTEKIKLTINSDINPLDIADIDLYDDLMSVQEASMLLRHRQIKENDIVEIWDGREDSQNTKYLATYTGRNGNDPAKSIEESSKQQSIKDQQNPTSSCGFGSSTQSTNKTLSANESYIDENGTYHLNGQIRINAAETNDSSADAVGDFYSEADTTSETKNLPEKTFLVFVGDKQNNTLIGSQGHDILDGKAGDDVLVGGFSDEYIFGGKGDDLIYGNAGYNIIEGGRGGDTFHISENGFSVIKDFDESVDSLQIDPGMNPNDIELDRRTLKYQGKRIARFKKPSLRDEHLKLLEKYDYLGIATKLYERPSGQKISYYVHDGSRSEISLERGSDSQIIEAVGLPNTASTWFDDVFRGLDYLLEAEFVRVNKAENADLRIWGATGKYLNHHNNDELSETIDGFANPELLLTNGHADIVINLQTTGTRKWQNASWLNEDNIHTSIHELGHALGLSHPRNNPNSALFNTQDTMMSYNKGNKGHPSFFSQEDIHALQSIWLKEQDFGEKIPGSYGETPKKTSKDIKAVVTTGGYDFYRDDINIALATFKLIGRQFEAVPRGWLAINPKATSQQITFGFDDNKDGIIQKDEARGSWDTPLDWDRIEIPFDFEKENKKWLEFANKVALDPDHPARGHQPIDTLFEKFSDPGRRGLLKIGPDRIYFDPNSWVGEDRDIWDLPIPGMTSPTAFQNTKNWKKNEFMTTTTFNGVELSNFSPIPEKILNKPKYQSDWFFKDYDYFMDQIEAASIS